MTVNARLKAHHDMTEALLQMETWWNDAPEMKRVEVLCGDKLRFCVRFYELDLAEKDENKAEKKVAEHEAGTFLNALQGCIEQARK